MTERKRIVAARTGAFRPLALLAGALLVFNVSLLFASGEKGVLNASRYVRMRATTFDPKPVSRKVGPGESLRFFYGVDEIGHPAKSSFRFRVTAHSGSRSKVIFHQTLRPSSNRAHRGWKEGSADLSPFSGKDVTFRFDCEATNEKTSRLGQWAGVRFGRFVRRPGEFNVVLISLDTLRADHLGIHGYNRDTSPRLDRIARAGAHFLHGVAASCWTKPSHASVFTSLVPGSHGMVFRDMQGGLTRMSEKLTPIAETLQENGYITRAFTGGALMSGIYGFDRGFDLYRETHGMANPRFPSRDATSNFGAAIKWIAAHRRDRFFVFVHTYDIHEPYRHRKFVRPGMTGNEALHAAYDSGIHFVDNLVGNLVDRLAELGLADSTLVVLFSDHGDELFEHGYTNSHGHSLYEDQIHVPVIFFNPARVKPRSVDDALIHHIDIAPTILDFVGIPRPRQYQGESFLPVLSGQKRTGDSVAFAELEYFNDTPVRVPKRQMKAVRYLGAKGNLKLIIAPSIARGRDDVRTLQKAGKESNEHRVDVWRDLFSAGGRQLFDLAADPHEKLNLAEKKPDLAEALEHYLARLEAMETADENAPRSNREQISPEMAEHLRSLGY